MSDCWLTIDQDCWGGYDTRVLSFCRIALACSHSSWENFKEKQRIQTKSLNWYTMNPTPFYWPKQVPSLIQTQRARIWTLWVKAIDSHWEAMNIGINGELWLFLQYLPFSDSSSLVLKTVFSLGRSAYLDYKMFLIEKWIGCKLMLKKTNLAINHWLWANFMSMFYNINFSH